MALALPLLKTMARTVAPALAVAASTSWHSSTGAAFTLFVVKTPAAVAGRSESTPPTSRRPLSLSPQRSPPALKPRTEVTSPVETSISEGVSISGRALIRGLYSLAPQKMSAAGPR